MQTDAPLQEIGNDEILINQPILILLPITTVQLITMQVSLDLAIVEL